MTNFFNNLLLMFNRFFGRIKNWFNSMDIKKWEIIFFSSVFLILFYSFMYNDIMDTTYHSMNMWTAVLLGKPFSFFSLNGGAVPSRSTGVWPSIAANYDIGIYIFFAVWNLPLWLIDTLFKIDSLSTFIGLAYAKTILLLPLFFTCFLVYKICRKCELNISSSYICVFTFLFSTLVCQSLVILGQYDIFAIAFLVAGIYFMLSNRHVLAYILIAYSICFKMFALLAIVPVFLYMKRSFVKATIWSILVFVPAFVIKLLCKVDPAYTAYSVFTQNNLMTATFSITWQFGSTPAVIFFVAYGIISIYSYILGQKRVVLDFKKDIYSTCFIISSVYVSMQLFSRATPYWSILIAPFITLILFMNNRNFRFASFILIFASFFYTLSTISSYEALWVGKYTSQMIFSIFNKVEPGSQLMGLLTGTSFYSCLGAAFPSYAGLIPLISSALSIVLFVTYLIFMAPTKVVLKNNSQVCRWPMYLTFALSVICCCFIFACYFYCLSIS